MWTDTSGKFKVKAKFTERVDNLIRLETEDGRLITVPIEKLSPFDKKYLETANKNNEPVRLANRYRISVESLKEHAADYKKEVVIRAAESAKNDLPRVKLETSAGNIVIELFENCCFSFQLNRNKIKIQFLSQFFL